MAVSAARGMCRGATAEPEDWIEVASSVSVRFSGPPISIVSPRAPGSAITRSTSAATSFTETKLIGFSPRPNTIT